MNVIDEYDEILNNINNKITKKKSIDEILSHVIKLRKLNRNAKRELHQLSIETIQKKKDLDKESLELQSWLYEASHLRKGVSVAEEYTTEVNNEDHISLKEECPSNLDDDEIHLLRMKRFAKELEQRKVYLEKCEEMKAEKQRLSELIAEKRVLLNGLDGQLDSFESYTKPIRENFQLTDSLLHMAMPPDNRYTHLPNPLYFLYHQFWSYANSTGQSIVVNDKFKLQIEGKISNHIQVKHNDFSVAEPVRKKFKQLQNIEGVHPLCIVVQAKMETLNLNLKFSYISSLNLVLVKSEAGGSVENLLQSIYPDDNGNELGTNDNGAEYLYDQTKGKPYYWLQMLCGLLYTHPRLPNYPIPSVSQLLSKIRTRSFALGALDEQLKSYNSLQLPNLSMFQHYRWMKIIPQTCIQEFNQCTIQDFINIYSLTTNSKLNVNQFKNFSCYKLLLKCNEVEVNTIVAISPMYPHEPPIFAMKLMKLPQDMKVSFKNVPLVQKTSDADSLQKVEEVIKEANNGLDDANFLEIECFVNTSLPELKACSEDEKMKRMNFVLSFMLRRAMISIDIYSQRLLFNQENQPFPDANGRLFLNASRGRDRRLPLKFNDYVDSFV